MCLSGTKHMPSAYSCVIEGTHAATVTVRAILAYGYNVGISERFGSAVIRGK